MKEIKICKFRTDAVGAGFKPAPTLYVYSLFVSAGTLLLILAGGLVTSHEAGLAVPDWPLSYGRFFPPMVGNIFWEHGHRMIAGSVGIFTLLLAVMIQIHEERKWMKTLGWIAFGAVLLQALLGGLTVRMLLPPPVSIAHACLAQTFFCLMIAITFFLRETKVRAGLKPAPTDNIKNTKLKRLSLMTTGFIYLQLILGATIRHTKQGVIPHVIVAFLVVIHVLLVVLRVGHFHQDKKDLSRLSIGFGILTVIQIFLGMGAFIFTRMLSGGYAPSSGDVFFATAHQTTGALVLVSSVLITLMAWL